ncbi:armadillo-type protein [Xylariaceae sp. FL1019]|nr:armadillo-type protein [Xylariaceae sp. FL1019]
MGSRPYRHSIDINGQYKDASGETTPTASMSPANSQALSTPPKLQSSFSANDVPTMKNMPTAGGAPTNAANAHAQQHFHNHNASMGRIPPGAVPKRHSRELSSDSHTAVTQAGTFPSIQSQLQGGAPSFALPTTQGSGLQSPISPTNGGSVVSPGSYQYYNNYNQTGPNGNYGNNLVGLNGNYGNNPAAHNGTYGNNNNGMGALAMGMQHMNINAMNGINGMNGVNGMNGFAMSAAQQQYTGYSGQYQPAIQPRDSQQRVIAQRRAQNDETMSRFANHTLDDFQGQIYSLCKDQYGCRFLQKQLEGRNPDDTRKIWLETNQHVVELMTDPFGNYLCQKLLEYCTNDERTVLIQNAATDMVRIALNQHGTRALQKMIEHVSIPVHVQIIIEALRHNVVALIQDLNGNHVIQKCLNKLSSADADFIFDAVGHDCVGVGTHRHGCCVLQRCIDHADGQQKINLVNAITEHALLLVQDPFGNYVVQYIIDLNDPLFTEPLVRQFAGRICSLSRHKFSSNVVEKCLRCASDQSKDMMINELLVPGEADRLLKDSYGNYVIQTALDHSSPHMKDQLIKTIKDSLNGIKGTPYGRRLHAKIQQLGGDTSGSTTNPQKVPTDITQGQIGAIHDPQTAMASQSVLAPAIYTNGLNATRTSMSYPTTANIATIMPRQNHPNTEYQPRRLNPYQTYPGTGKNHTNGEGTFF